MAAMHASSAPPADGDSDPGPERVARGGRQRAAAQVCRAAGRPGDRIGYLSLHGDSDGDGDATYSYSLGDKLTEVARGPGIRIPPAAARHP
jgi:hypothetical protein